METWGAQVGSGDVLCSSAGENVCVVPCLLVLALFFLFQSLVKRLETRYLVEPVMKNEFHSVMKNYRM